MTEGFHRGGVWNEDIAALPINWRAESNLKYPLEINLADGSKKSFRSYDEHHKFIRSLFPHKKSK